jgi:hypothetical protein
LDHLLTHRSCCTYYGNMITITLIHFLVPLSIFHLLLLVISVHGKESEKIIINSHQ